MVTRRFCIFDANHLYGYALSQSLPCGDLKFDLNTDIEAILATADDSEICYFCRSWSQVSWWN